MSDGDWLDLFQKRLGPNELEPGERAAISQCLVGTFTYNRGERILLNEIGKDALHLVIRGWAARVCTLETGAAQITDVFLSGDLCGVSTLTGAPSNEVVAVSALRVALLDRTALLNAIDTRAKLSRALLHLALAEQAILREWIVGLGLRDKRKHLAHLLCELHCRLFRVGLATADAFDLPLTQEQLSQVIGATAVHTNRMLQQLRKEGVIRFESRVVQILKPSQLVEIAEFDGAYLKH